MFVKKYIMKNTKISISQIVTFIIVMILIQLLVFKTPTKVNIIISTCLILFVIFNILIRKKSYFKKYFTSPLNIFSAKFKTVKTFDLPDDLLFEKIKEVLIDQKHTVFYENNDTKEIYATTKMNWRSWGANIYIDFKPEKEGAAMNFKSSAIFGVFDFTNEHEKIYNGILIAFDKSLII